MWNLFSSANDISASQVIKKIDDGWRPYIIDVRSRGEANQTGVMKGTKLIHPHGKIAEKRKELPRDRDILIICRSGARSSVALNKLKAIGFENDSLFNLKGGIKAYARAGGAIKRL
ncbi:MAG: rhodanese-like domain-containing protein [Euryarchaeota archaeon]|jgi:rhodanese-related sulfurtransferase|nr:rhodanese-like domain-containing protein [Euryarchaeota archaeon]